METTLQIIDLISDVTQAKHDLAALNLDPVRLRRCATAIHDLEETLEELVTFPWTPKTMAGVNGAISAVQNNIRKTETLIDGRMEGVWDRQVPDEVLRMNITLIVLDALRFQLGALIEAQVRMLKSTLVGIESEFVN